MKKISLLTFSLLISIASIAQTNIANFDFNGGTSYPISAVSTASNVTATINGSEANAAYNGTVTGSSAFVQNTTAGNALSMSANDTTNYWVLTLGGSNLNQYLNYNLYFQAEHSPTGAVSLALSWSIDGSSYTALSQTVALGASNTYVEDIVSLSNITNLNGASSIYIKFSPKGATGNSGTIRIDNLQIQASTSPWTTSGGNVNFTGGVSASSFTVSGDARLNGLSATSSGVSVTNPTIFSNTIKSTTFSGSGNRLLLTDANGNISPLSQGTSSQVLYGNGTWETLPPSTFTTTGSNAYFTGGNIGIGTSSPQNPLDVNGNARVVGNIDVSSITLADGQTGINFVPASSTSTNQNLMIFGGNSSARPIGWNTCTNHPTINNQWVTIFPNSSLEAQNTLQLIGHTASNQTNVLSMGFDGLNGFIDLAGQNSQGGPGLLLDWYCGKDVDICTNYGAGDGTGLGSNGNGGVVNVGFNLNVGAPYPQDNNIALNLKAHGTTAFNVQDNNSNSIFQIASTGNIGINGHEMFLNGLGDPNHILGVYQNYSSLNTSVNGPVLQGYTGGALATTQNGSNTAGLIALQWNNYGDVIIPHLPSAGVPTGQINAVLVDATGKLIPGAVVNSTNAIDWTLNGNANTNSAAIGTTDASSDLPFLAGGSEKVRIFANGGINLSNNNGVIQCGGTSPITTTSDMGLYSQRSGYYMRFVTNAGNFNFYSNVNDGTSSTGTPVFSIGNDGSTTIKSTSSTNSPFKITNNTLPTGGAITSGANAQTAFEVAANGQVFIGPQRVTSSAQANAILQVAGDLVVGNTSGTTGGIYVTQYFWADFVFDKNYKLTPLNEVENFYKKNHHLPNVPSEKEIRENGNNLAQTDVALLQKIEELTLYLVEQKKISEQQQKEIEELKALMKNNKK